MIPEGRQLCFDCEAQLFENDVSQKEIASAPGTESSKINFLSTLPRVFKRKNKKSWKNRR